MKKNIARIMVGVFILLTLGFIFTNSMRSQAASSEQSDSFREILRAIIPEDFAFADWILNNVRKIAHFCEFALLGFEVAVCLMLLEPEKRRWKNGILFGWITAFLDETIQIFSGRGSAVQDVWLDFSGYVAGEVIVCLSAFVIVSKRRALQKRKLGAKS